MSESKTELCEEHFLAINYMLCYSNERLFDILIFGFLALTMEEHLLIVVNCRY